MGRVRVSIAPVNAAREALAQRVAPLRHVVPHIVRFTLLVLLFADGVLAEAQLGAIAATGAGAGRVEASPALVVMMLLACAGVAVLLSWDEVVALARRVSSPSRPDATGSRRPLFVRGRGDDGGERSRSAGERKSWASRQSPLISLLVTRLRSFRLLPSAMALLVPYVRRRKPGEPATVGQDAIPPAGSDAPPASPPHPRTGRGPGGEDLRDWLRDRLAPLIAGSLRAWMSLLLGVAALAGTLVCVALLSGPVETPLAQWPWLASMALLAASAALWPSRTASALGAWASSRVRAVQLSRSWRTFAPRHADALLVATIVAVGLALRLPNLTGLPYVVHGDEAWNGLEARRWLAGEIPSLFGTGWYGLPVLDYGLPALVMRFAGNDLYGLRLSSVILGTVSLVLLYALARELCGRRVAFTAAMLLGVAQPHIQFSRVGIHYIHAVFAVLLALWLLVRALRRRSALYAVLAALAMSLCLQVYFSARLVFVIVPLFVLGMLVLNRRLLAGRGAVLGWLALGLVVGLGPWAVYFAHHPDVFNSRTNEVLLLRPTPYLSGHLRDAFGTDDPRVVISRQLAAIPLVLSGVADQSTQYGPRYPLLDALTAALATIGFFYALMHLRRPLYLLLWLWVTTALVVGGVLTNDMPEWPRLIVMLPAACLLAALALDEALAATWRELRAVVEAARPIRRVDRRVVVGIATALTLAAITFSGVWSTQRYFTDYPRQVNGDAWRTEYTDIGLYAGTLPPGTRFILFSDDRLVADYGTLRFLGPGATGERILTPDALQRALAERPARTVVVVTLSRVADFEALSSTWRQMPRGTFAPYRTANGEVTFYTFTFG